MLLINFSHPLIDEQMLQIKTFINGEIDRVITIPIQLDQSQSFQKQIRSLVDAVDLSPEEWQTLPILINPPSYNFAAATLLAELHGRMGYFPSILRIRLIPDTTPPRYEVAEIINLQDVRNEARQKR